MPELTKISTALKLDADATEDIVLAAIAKLSEPPAPAKTLDQAAADAGKVLLNADEIVKLRQDAADGADAKKQLVDQRFDAAYTKALAAVCVDAKDETRTEWRELYDAAPDVAIKRLEALTPIVSTKAKGTGGKTDEDVPDIGNRQELHAAALARAAEKNIDYVVALDAVIAEA